MKKIQDMFQEMDENMIILILSIFTTFIVVVFGIYFMYMYNLKDKECEVMAKFYPNANQKMTNTKTDKILKDYCIKAAYNCCSLGSYKNDYVGTCILKHILEQGVRFLDFEIFSINDYPVVATSVDNNFHEKQVYNYINFNEIIDIIQYNAFGINPNVKNSGDPLILHLRFKSNNPIMFKNLNDILTNRQSDINMLDKTQMVSKSNKNKDGKPVTELGETSIKVLKGKTCIIVDDSLKICSQCPAISSFIHMQTSINQLRLYPYYDIRQATSNTLTDMLKYNTDTGMTICIPDRDNNPGNPNLLVTNGSGNKLAIDCNIVAMRYQQMDDNLLIYNNVFDYFGRAFLTKSEIRTAIEKVMGI